MKVITIEGEQNSGKTTLVRNVLRRLVNDGAEVLYYRVYGHLLNDFYAVVIWRARKIMLYSIGDRIDYIQEGLEFLKGTEWIKGVGSDILVNTRTLSVDEKQYKRLLPPECDLRSVSVTPPPKLKNIEPFVKKNQVALESIMAMLSE
ncbi:MAG: hypothetical protein HDR35_10625 [Treponema sp.]|nr:hypothetical protein [Treponema sp.]MBD5434727.1 hypothetical protein [Treponema sp.]